MDALTSDLQELDQVLVAAEKLELTTDIYREIRHRLAQRGVPPDQVVFIHEAKNSAARARLFQAVNEGRKRVLIGSSEKMGTGMNAQERLVAIHQITPPWRPADIQQQLGRMHRQGNRYLQVFQFVYVTEGSFDGYMWQTLETKMGFIDQVDADYSVREVADISENALTFSEIKALASGNPKIIEMITLDVELTRLAAVRASWQSSRRHAEMRQGRLEYVVAGLKREIATLEMAIRTRDAETGDFTIQLRKSAYTAAEQMVTFTQRELAGNHLRTLVNAAAVQMFQQGSRQLTLGQYRGLVIKAWYDHRASELTAIPIIEVGDSKFAFSGATDKGILMSLDTRLRKLDNLLTEAHDKLESTLQDQQMLAVELEQPWEHQAAYEETLVRYHALEAELDADDAARIDLTSHTVGPDPESALAQSQAKLREALDALQALHTSPEILARFDLAPEAAADTTPAVSLPQGDAMGGTTPVPAIQELRGEIETKQAELAQLQFALSVAEVLPQATVQLDMFGGHRKPQTKRRRRRPVTPNKAQLALFDG